MKIPTYIETVLRTRAMRQQRRWVSMGGRLKPAHCAGLVNVGLTLSNSTDTGGPVAKVAGLLLYHAAQAYSGTLSSAIVCDPQIPSGLHRPTRGGGVGRGRVVLDGGGGGGAYIVLPTKRKMTSFYPQKPRCPSKGEGTYPCSLTPEKSSSTETVTRMPASTPAWGPG